MSKSKLKRLAVQRGEETMSDLTKQLRKFHKNWRWPELAAAANRIEALEAENAALKQTLQLFYDYGYDRQVCGAAIDKAKEKP